MPPYRGLPHTTRSAGSTWFLIWDYTSDFSASFIAPLLKPECHNLELLPRFLNPGFFLKVWGTPTSIQTSSIFCHRHLYLLPLHFESVNLSTAKILTPCNSFCILLQLGRSLWTKTSPWRETSLSFPVPNTCCNAYLGPTNSPTKLSG